MSSNFFEQELGVTEQRAPIPLIPQCSSCNLYRHCNSPKMPIYGLGEKGIFICGEAPGRREDEKNRPFVGKAGQRLRGELKDLDIHPYRDCWIYNSIICRPKNNAKPTDAQINYCRPNVIREIERLKPKVIILLGGVAVKSVLGWLFREDCGGVTKWAGSKIPSQKLNAWICPTFHPSFLEYRKNPVIDLWFERHLTAAVEIRKRPWKKIPNYKDQVKIILNDDEAAAEINRFTKRGVPTAFDYEADRIKPDHPDASIYSCSLSDGKHTISFPWLPKARKAMEIFLWSPVPKIGQHIKFEQKWTHKEFGFWIDSWIHDDMLWSHILDNRPGITGIEFQAFSLLGYPPWDGVVSGYLKSKGGKNSPNRIRECPLPDLLLYGGIDALVEYKVYKKQKKEIECLSI